MIRLHSNARRETRLLHVLKHYYHPAERFFDLISDVFEWLEEWNVLRAGGAFSEGGAGRIAPGTTEDQVAQRGHGRWLEVAQRALVQALERGAAYREQARGVWHLLGDGGVIVIAQWDGGAYHLVTCYRAVPSWFAGPRSQLAVWEDRARDQLERKVATGGGMIRRAAVRRELRAASLQGEPLRPARPGAPDNKETP